MSVKQQSFRFFVAAVASFALVGAANAQDSTRANIQLSLDSLLNTQVNAASKFAQAVRDAPASVSVITGEEIARFGYQTMSDVLMSVQGLYLTNDRNYTYLGVRGFNRPGDYNDRILLLIDGHSLNDPIWGQATVGDDFPIDLAAIERVEVMRGAGSAVFGTDAVLAVVNVVTKSASSLDGADLKMRRGSFGDRDATALVGKSIGRLGFAGSATWGAAAGPNLYYPEFDNPSTNNGLAVGHDWRRNVSAYGTATFDGWTLRAMYRDRHKGVPTGAFDSDFRTGLRTGDYNSFFDLRYTRSLTAPVQLSVRTFFDTYRYTGIYPEPDATTWTDGADANTWGSEAMLRWDFTSRARLTTGLEHRRVTEAVYYENIHSPNEMIDDGPYSFLAWYAQGEYEIGLATTLTAGVRQDWFSSFGGGVAPRFAVVSHPTKTTTLKLLYGEAFRAPNASEALLSTSFYTENRSIKAERLRSMEVEGSKMISDHLLAIVSVYRFRIHDLIDQVSYDSATGVKFANVASANAHGVELDLEGRVIKGVTSYLIYALQRATDGASGDVLSNSPRQIAKVGVSSNLPYHSVGALETRYESGRLTLQGISTPAFALVNANLSLPTLERGWRRRIGGSIRVENVLNTAWATPGGLEHRQAMIYQDGRTWSVQLQYRLF